LIEPQDAVRFLWSGQNGVFELARTDGDRVERRLYGMEEALDALTGNDRFGPLARRPFGAGVAEIGNVLWIDLDKRDGVLDRFDDGGYPPSLLIDSGHRGFWAFWKLARPISSDEIQAWNRRFAERFDGDREACHMAQLARLPGSYREETGKRAEAVQFSAALYEPEELVSLRGRPWRSRLRLRRAPR
jgi:hypothetical protein